MVNGPFTYTPSGKKRAPSKELVLQWIHKAWQEIPADLVANSFKSCGISNAMDGTEDEAVWEEEGAGADEADDDYMYFSEHNVSKPKPRPPRQNLTYRFSHS